jgi:HSP20 family molecular chaperone IbpA
MYIVLGLILLPVLWIGSLLGQQDIRPIDDQAPISFEKISKLREGMHLRMMEQLMDEMMTDSFRGLSSFSTSRPKNYKLQWSESSEGRTLAITPKKPEQQLDINVMNGFISIKGKVENKTLHGTSISSFSNSFNVPGDCDSSQVKMLQKDGKILVYFPYLEVKAGEARPKKQERIPIGPSDDDVQI